MSVDEVTEWSERCEDDHTRATQTEVTNPPTEPSVYRTDTAEAPPRCDHGLTACRRCYTAPPGVNRFYPPPRGVKAQMHEQGRWMMVVPNRADRRRADRVTRVTNPGGDR